MGSIFQFNLNGLPEHKVICNCSKALGRVQETVLTVNMRSWKSPALGKTLKIPAWWFLHAGLKRLCTRLPNTHMHNFLFSRSVLQSNVSSSLEREPSVCRADEWKALPCMVLSLANRTHISCLPEAKPNNGQSSPVWGAELKLASIPIEALAAAENSVLLAGGDGDVAQSQRFYRLSAAHCQSFPRQDRNGRVHPNEDPYLIKEDGFCPSGIFWFNVFQLSHYPLAKRNFNANIQECTCGLS